MINAITFDIEFEYKGKIVEYVVDKMMTDRARIPEYFRVTAKTGNRDLHKVGDNWKLCSGPPLAQEIIDLVGKAIEEGEKNDYPYKARKRAFF